jgi:hypothetical protein
MTQQKLNEFIDREKSHYFKANNCPQDGWTNEASFKAGAELLLPMLLEAVEALEYYKENAEPLFCEYVGEYPQGGYQQVLGEWTLLEKILNSINERIK